jgi:hypothetical protein
MPNGTDWFSDVPISLPDPPPNDPQIDLGGFWFTNSGICHNITAATVEDLSKPSQSQP